MVVYGHSVKYSHEIPNEYLSGLMAISLLAYVAIFSDSFIFGKATSLQFFRVTFFKVSQELLFQGSSLFRADDFFEELLFQKSLFSSIFFPEYLLVQDEISTQKPNSLVQIPFRTATHRRHLQKNYFFEADSSTQHQPFQKSKLLKKPTFPVKQNSALPTFSGELPF